MSVQKKQFIHRYFSVNVAIFLLQLIPINLDKVNAIEDAMPDTCWQAGNGTGKVTNYGGDNDGHTEAISRIAFSPDGNFLVSSGLDGPISAQDSQIKYSHHRKSSNSIKVWDLTANSGEGRLDTNKLNVSDSSIFAIAFSPDGNFFVDGTTRGVIRLWDWNNNKLIENKITNHITISDLKFSEDSNYLVSISADDRNNIKIWNFNQGKLSENRSLKSMQIVRTVAFTPNGKTLITAGMGKYIEFWDIDSGQSLRKLNDDHEIFSIALSPDGQYIASAGWDTKIKLRSVGDGTIQREFSGNFNRINSIAFSPNGRYLLSGSGDKSVKLWNVQTSKLIEKYTFLNSQNVIQDSVTSVSFHPSGRKFAFSSADNRLRIFSTKCNN
jgi:WD40 repeat protein